MEMTGCDKCKYHNSCSLAGDYNSLYCNDYEEAEHESLFEND